MDAIRAFRIVAVAYAISASLAGCFQAPGPDEPDRPDPSTDAAGSPGAGPAPRPAGARPEAPPPDPVTEMDLGVPLYPGAALLQAQSSKKAGADASAITGVFAVADPPAVVAAYYRDYLLARAQGAHLLETATPAGGVMLVLDEPGSDTAVQVEISPEDDGSRVKVTSVVFPIG